MSGTVMVMVDNAPVSMQDNTSLLGLTLDYGPYCFLQTYKPGFVAVRHAAHAALPIITYT